MKHHRFSYLQQGEMQIYRENAMIKENADRNVKGTPEVLSL